MNQGNDLAKDELTVRDYLAPVRRRFWLVLLPVLVLPLLVEVNRRGEQVDFRSSAAVLVTESEASRALTVAQPTDRTLTRELSAEVELALSDEVRARVEDRVGVVDRDELGTITAEAEEEDQLIFRVRANSREASADLANAWAEEYLAARQAVALDAISDATAKIGEALDSAVSERGTISGELDGLEYRLNRSEDPAEQLELRRQIQLRRTAVDSELAPVDAQVVAYAENVQELAVAADLVSVQGATIIRRATPDDAVSTASSGIILAIFAVMVGGMLGVGAVMLLEILDSKVRGIGDFGERGLPLEVLGSVPEPRRLNRISSIDELVLEAGTTTSDAFDRLRAAVAFLAAEREIKTLAVVDPLGQKSKTWAATHLGLAFAGAGRKVLLVDANRQESPLTSWVDVHPYKQNGEPLGLVEVGHLPGAIAAGSLTVAPKGTDPAEVGTDGAAGRSDHLTKHDIVIYNAPPVLTGPDSVLLASQVDAVLLVAETGVTEREDTRRTIVELDRAGGRLLGVALVGARVKSKQLVEL